jgi:protein tyrosine phosphatase
VHKHTNSYNNNQSSDSGVSGLAGDDDYINASWVTQRIDDLDLTNIYIAAQVREILI